MGIPITPQISTKIGNMARNVFTPTTEHTLHYVQDEVPDKEVPSKEVSNTDFVCFVNRTGTFKNHFQAKFAIKFAATLYVIIYYYKEL